MNDIDFKIFCETRLKEIISKGPKPFLYYININNVLKQLPIGITPMIIDNNSGKKRLWSLISETQSESDFKKWCLV